ncbi:MAG: NADH-quinone oxidoreductase subunit N [Terriglobales bacterium]
MSFTAAQWTALGPLIALTATAVVAMVGIGVHRSHRGTLIITLAGLAITIWRIWPAAHVAPVSVTPLLRLDGYALFFIGLAAGAAFVVALLAWDYLEKTEKRHEEFYVLLVIAALGAAVLAASSDFVSFFLSLEVLSIALYGLNAYPQGRALPLEAGIKYLVLASSSAAFLLFGMALVYAATGTMQFATLAARLPHASGQLVLPGVALILVGIGFKLGLVPFHLWTPDVYQGAPAPVTAFVATASKAGIFAVLLRYFYESSGAPSGRLFLVLTILAFASMVVGNLMALRQTNVKRILAFSSIAHMGYITVAFLAASRAAAMAAAAVGFYFLAYFITTLGAFGVIAALTSRTRGEPDGIEDYRGLFWRRPWLALVFTAMLLSLAGIPLTAGFLAKFYIVAAGTAASLWMLLLVLFITSVIGLFYYLRIVVALYSPLPQTIAAEGPLALPVARTGAWVLGVLLVALVWVGVYPATFIRMMIHFPLR